MALSSQMDALQIDYEGLDWVTSIPDSDPRPHWIQYFNLLPGELTPRPSLKSSINIGVPTGLSGDLLCPRLYYVKSKDKHIFAITGYDLASSKWKFWYRDHTKNFCQNTAIIPDSETPHRVVAANNRLYVLATDTANSNKLQAGQVWYDDSTGVIKVSPWGALGPQTEAQVQDQATWTTLPAETITVNFGWIYAYSYKTITGHITNRSPVKTTSDTGPFTDKVPKIQIEPHTDATNFPKIIIWRTTDGGGTFYKLAEIDNPGGTTPVTFEDNAGPGGGPVPDFELDIAFIAPTMTSNSPPPRVLPPKVTGVDAPNKFTTRMVYYAGRIWYGIENRLVYSNNEEQTEGIPLESFDPNNYFDFDERIMAIEATTSALYVFTPRRVYRITGFREETFEVEPLYTHLGYAGDVSEGLSSLLTPSYRSDECVASIGNVVFWVANNYEIYASSGGSTPVKITTPISNTFKSYFIWWTLGQDSSRIGTSLRLRVVPALGRYFLVVTRTFGYDPNNYSHLEALHLVADIDTITSNRFPKWAEWTMDVDEFTVTEIETVAVCNWRDYSTGSLKRSISALSNYEYLNYCYDTVGNPRFTILAQSSWLTVPPGNHVNALRAPELTPVFSHVSIRYTATPGNQLQQSHVLVKLDYSSGNQVHTMIQDLPRGEEFSDMLQGVKYSRWVVNRAASRISFFILVPQSGSTIPFTRIDEIDLVWEPEAVD